MCGIAGIVRLNSAASAGDVAAVSRMIALQRKRGPDGEGMHAEGAVVFGHRRLSIIDLSDGARQPMSNEAADIWVTFNGEIYNYRDLRRELTAAGRAFRGASDTETLIHGYEEWGWDGLLKRLRGMFAFALYDAKRASSQSSEPFFFAARDRLGIKPLYYSEGDGRFAFASEVKALVGSGVAAAGADRAAIASFLALGSIPFPRTSVRSVACLPPGHAITIGRGGRAIAKYWELSYERRPDSDMGALLRDSVERHLMADVPVGVFLSGGVDSAAIACLASRGRRIPIRTLTVVFDEAEFSEAGKARQLADAFGTEHHEIRVTGGDFARTVPDFLSDMDQPTADGVNTYFVSQAAKQLGLKVVLSGLGGDEVFFGYGHYRRLSGGGLLGGYAASNGGIRRSIESAASLYGRLMGRERWQRFDYGGDLPLDESLYLILRGFFPPARICRLLGAERRELDDILESSFGAIRMAGGNGHMDPNSFHYLEVKRYLHDQLLRDSDVFSMVHSIELRVPLLDHPLVDASCAAPPERKIRGDMNKPMLVDAVGDANVRACALEPKRGFTFPFARWMAVKVDELEARALEGSVLDPGAVRECWKDFRAGRLHWSRAWATTVLAANVG